MDVCTHHHLDVIRLGVHAVDDGLFFVALVGEKLAGTVMAGYDGHRGWIYSLAVAPSAQKLGIGSRLVRHTEEKLIELGCLKVNLQIMEGNEQVRSFYEANGYAVEKRVSMGKRLAGQAHDNEESPD